jgi:ubiquinone/menaquinone biosynthesis C-methylase UbiE
MNQTTLTAPTLKPTEAPASTSERPILDTGLLICLRCPACEASRLEKGAQAIHCGECGRSYPFEDGILDLVGPSETVGTGSADDEAQAQYWEHEEGMYRPYDHEVALGFAEQRARYVRSVLPLSEVRSAVDVGAGNGMSTYCLEGDIEQIVSTDLSRRLLNSNPARIRMRTDAYRLPFRDKSVDMAYAWELLHHVDTPRRVLAEMKRISRRYVLIFEPNRWNPAQVAFALLHKPDRMCLRNTRSYLVAEAEAAGLELIHHATVGWFTPNVPPVWLYRILRHLPFHVPLIGLSHFLALRCPDK